MSLRRAAMLVLAWVAGCGASPRMLHQSEAYYEHCHAADLDPERSNAERIECWTAWLEHYREGMPPERVLHARRRLAGLEDGAAPDPLPDVTPAFSATFLALQAGPDGASDGSTSNADGSTSDGSTSDGSTSDGSTSDAATSATGVVAEGAASPEAGSPPTLEGVEPVEAARPARDPAHRPPRPRPLSPRGSSPTHPCTPVCEPRWAACVDRAEGRGMDGLEACRMEHRICLQACM